MNKSFIRPLADLTLMSKKGDLYHFVKVRLRDGGLRLLSFGVQERPVGLVREVLDW